MNNLMSHEVRGQVKPKLSFVSIDMYGGDTGGCGEHFAAISWPNLMNILHEREIDWHFGLKRRRTGCNLGLQRAKGQQRACMSCRQFVHCERDGVLV